ncbi:hypothetical protein CANCADRAFT_2592 [Tortispora caseinolytica NRRL Y-17796]|uniref:Uncharacterized protein n=1 Tax=Tortispora caseinolytica NRRL Y-17796 TaxID=767744 RepID=A0A1E4TGG9_9ASCO|nr:hypothetical protein CANCADRAFT_2592 [Tortispora caseinolytica NRRL Y-17796]
MHSMRTVTETKTFLCEPPVETTTVYGRVYSSDSGVVTAYDADCEKKIVSTDGWYCCQCAPTVISYVPRPDDKSPYVWGFYERIDVSVSVDVDIKVEVPVVVTVIPTTAAETDLPASSAAGTVTSNIVASGTSTSTASEIASTDAELCSSIPPYTSDMIYAVGYDTTAEDFEYVANGGYRSAVSTPLDASLDSSGIIVQETIYQPLVELMFYASGRFEISQLVSNTGSAYGYVFAGQSAMSCNDIKEIGTGGLAYNGSLDGGWSVNAQFSGQWYPIRVVVSQTIDSGRKRQIGHLTVGMSGQYKVVGELAQATASSTTALASSAYYNSTTPSAGLPTSSISSILSISSESSVDSSASTISSSGSASLVGTVSSDSSVSSPSTDSYVSTANPNISGSSFNIPSSVSSTALYSYDSSSAVASSSSAVSSSISVLSIPVCSEKPGFSPGVQFFVYAGGNISSFSGEEIANGTYRSQFSAMHNISSFPDTEFQLNSIGGTFTEAYFFVEGANTLVSISQTSGNMLPDTYYLFIGTIALECGAGWFTIGTGGYSAQAPGGSDTWNINFPLDRLGMWYPIRIVAQPLADASGTREFKVTFTEPINPVGVIY